uniref:Uncharacterized protein n=1 Tax=Crocodylus porosus TaxID=8502 RepID=A0A7M4FY53_CROPO
MDFGCFPPLLIFLGFFFVCLFARHGRGDQTGQRSCPARIPERALAAARIELRTPSKHICGGLREEGWGWGTHKPASLNPEVGSGLMAKLPGPSYTLELAPRGSSLRGPTCLGNSCLARLTFACGQKGRIRAPWPVPAPYTPSWGAASWRRDPLASYASPSPFKSNQIRAARGLTFGSGVALQHIQAALSPAWILPGAKLPLLPGALRLAISMERPGGGRSLERARSALPCQPLPQLPAVPRGAHARLPGDRLRGAKAGEMQGATRRAAAGWRCWIRKARQAARGESSQQAPEPRRDGWAAEGAPAASPERFLSHLPSSLCPQSGPSPAAGAPVPVVRGWKNKA